MNPQVKVLLVEDEPLWQQGVAALLAAAGGLYDLAAVVDNFEDGMRAFETLRPDFVLLDLKIIGERDGLDLGHALLDAGMPPERIILISGSSASVIPAHPFLFVPKSRISGELLPLLESIPLQKA